MHHHELETDSYCSLLKLKKILKASGNLLLLLSMLPPSRSVPQRSAESGFGNKGSIEHIIKYRAGISQSYCYHYFVKILMMFHYLFIMNLVMLF